MACRAFKIQVKADEDPLGREVTVIRKPKAGSRTHRTGSVVGIQFEVAKMYTGTLISDLMATVERVERKAEQQRIAEELHTIFAMQISPAGSDQFFQGAA